ncbi:hypothetical protein [Streptomyces sp. NPDC093269]|uniref:hypothetical protein n=1 Tax=Streptomyces sp. NPDC093269 TaxID=3366038 RepID=UPI003814685C
MSAAEPAETTHLRAPLNKHEGAAVIDITKRRGKGRGRQASGGWKMDVTPPPTGQAAPEGRDRHAALVMVANDLEKSFNRINRTLTDDETAAVYTHTLGLFELALRGAEAQGIIDGDQLEELGVLIGGMKEAPRLV